MFYRNQRAGLRSSPATAGSPWGRMVDGRGIKLGRGRRAGKEGRVFLRPDPAQPDPTLLSNQPEPGAALARPELVVRSTTGGGRNARGVTGGTPVSTRNNKYCQDIKQKILLFKTVRMSSVVSYIYKAGTETN